jgi:hypothetical protein
MLSVSPETPHHHVVLHPLMQRVDRCLLDRRIQGEVLRPKLIFTALRHHTHPSREAGSSKLAGGVTHFGHNMNLKGFTL